MKHRFDLNKVFVVVVSFFVLLALQNNAVAQFDEQFNSSTLDPAWQVVTFTGTRVYGYTSPANHISLTDNPGYLRYYLDPMTHYDGFAYNFQTSYGPLHSCCNHDPGLELRRTISGENWLLEAKASYYLPYTNGRYFTLDVYFGDGGIGTFSVQFQRYRDLGESRLRVMLVEKADSDPHIWPALEYADTSCPTDYSTFYFKLERSGGVLTALWSEDGTTWNTAFTHDMGTLLDGLTQTVVVTGLSWFNTGGSYADWDYITVTPTIETVSIDIKPGSCPNPLNVKSRGVLPVVVLGTEDLDVSSIDPATIRLSREGVEDKIPPLRWSYEDVGTPFEGELCGCHALKSDGYIDLSIKFDIQALITTLKLGEVIGNTFPITLTGNLKEEFGGTPIKGQDCIWVLK